MRAALRAEQALCADETPANVIRQHLSRHLKGVHDLHPDWQRWADDVRQVLKDAHCAVEDAIAARQPALDPALLAGLRERYDQAVHRGEITNRHRDWDDGKNHPGSPAA